MGFSDRMRTWTWRPGKCITRLLLHDGELRGLTPDKLRELKAESISGLFAQASSKMTVTSPRLGPLAFALTFGRLVTQSRLQGTELEMFMAYWIPPQAGELEIIPAFALYAEEDGDGTGARDVRCPKGHLMRQELSDCCRRMHGSDPRPSAGLVTGSGPN